MAELQKKTYVATSEFSLNMDNGLKTVNVRPGDVMTFDGLYVEIGEDRGQARILAKVIGDWVKPYSGNVKKLQAVKSRKVASPAPEQRTRNLTGGRIVENSSVEQDPDATVFSQKEDYRDLERLVSQQESETNVTEVTNDMDDARQEAENTRHVEVIDDDASVVAQVSKEAHTDAQTNTSGVQMQDQGEERRPVVSMEEGVAKETNYSGKQASEDTGPKHLKVEHEGDGVEVKKVATPAINADDVKTSTVAEKTEVSVEEDVALETQYEDAGRTDVGSTTQAQVEARKSSSKKGTTRKASSTRKSSRRAKTASKDTSESKVLDDDQGARVVGKVSKTEAVSTDEGITSTMTIGSSGEMDTGDVEFSSNDNIDVGEATTSSSGENTAVDLSGVSEDGDIDVNDLLDNM